MTATLKKCGSEYRIYHKGDLVATAKTLAEAKQKAQKFMKKETKCHL